jgi:DNA-binding transcriptional ArsR family regulator
MSADELFEALSHPMRVEMIKALAEKPLRFADLKRELKIGSSGLLDFHLKKLDGLVAVNGDGCYSLTENGYAALTSVEGAARHYRLRQAHRRSFFINLAACTLVNVGAFWSAGQAGNLAIWYAVVLPATVAWVVFYGYWTFVRRRIRLSR